MFFRKKNRCAHTWVLRDYINYVDETLSFEERFEMVCDKCGSIKTSDRLEYERMKIHGLVN